LNKELQERLASIDEERRLELSLALRQERLRVAREMHDLVAHSLSLMVVQAGAARAISRKDRSEALEAMRSVVETGKQVVVELRQLISLLSVDEPSAAAQLPRADIPALLERARRDGIDVTFQEQGSQRPPSGGSVELSAYRIIQEALTNARKHAPGARVDVSIQYQPQSVELKIEDEGAAQDVTLSSFGTGHGLAGMRERVAMFGGELRAEPSSSGGFVVEASMPWSAAA
jgi:signal transduction histidine kinase